MTPLSGESQPASAQSSSMTLPAGVRKVIYVDRERVSTGEPAWMVRTATTVYRCSHFRIVGIVTGVQSDDRFIEGGPNLAVVTSDPVVLRDVLVSPELLGDVFG